MYCRNNYREAEVTCCRDDYKKGRDYCRRKVEISGAGRLIFLKCESIAERGSKFRS